jgi:flagellar hook-associated protein 2
LQTCSSSSRPPRASRCWRCRKRAKSYTSKLSAYGTIQSALGVLQAAAKKLGDPALFQSVVGTPTVSGILSASATDVSAAGNYTIT